MQDPKMLATYAFPTSITYGAGCVALVGHAARSAGLLRPLIVTDRGLAPLPPCLSLQRVLAEAGLEVATFSEVWGNPVASQVAAGAQAFAAHAADSIIAIGGGAALDVAKAMAVLVHHTGDILDYDAFAAEPLPIDREVPPIFALPTTAGTGSEVGRSAVISCDRSHAKKVIYSPKLLAQRVFLDPELTVGLPAAVTAATGMDALTHCVESYLAKAFHPMCDGIALEGLRLCGLYLPAAVKFAEGMASGADVTRDADHLHARGMMLNAAMMGAVAFQKDLGVIHSCAHALSTVSDLHHGLANAIMLPAGLRFNASVASERMAIMAQVVGAEDASADGFIRWVEALRATIGLPSTLAAVGVKHSALDRLVEVALADACHTFNPRPVSAADFRAIFVDAGLGDAEAPKPKAEPSAQESVQGSE